MACASDGDEALVVEPFYTNYSAFATMAGVRLVPLARARRGRLPPAAERGVGGCAHPAHAAGAPVQPQQPHRHRLQPRRAGDGARLLPRARALPGLRRGVPRARVRRALRDERAQAPGRRRGDGRRGQPLQALQRLRHTPGLPGDARTGTSTAPALRMAQGRLSPPGLAQLVALGANDARPGLRTRPWCAEYQAPPRRALRGPLSAIPGVFLRKPEGAFYFVARLPVDDGEDFARGCSPTTRTRAPR